MDSNSNWITYVARGGYASKCVVYAVLGIMILYAANSANSAQDISKSSVFKEILSSPFGSVSLTAVVIGLGCYVIWRFIQAILNPGDLDMSKSKEVVERVFYFVSAILYSLATFAAFKVLMSESSGQGQNGSQTMSEELMKQPYGVWVVGAIGLVIIIFAGIQFKHAVKQDFMDKFEVGSMSEHEKTITSKVGSIGFAARGVVYILVGGFLINAAMTYDPDKAGGLGKALTTLLQQDYGSWLLMLVGVGMLGYGAFCGFEARYRET